LEDLIDLLISAGVPKGDSLIVDASETVAQISDLYEKDEDKYLEAVDRDATYEQADALIKRFENNIRSIFDLYAKNYAERVFHDRQLCEQRELPVSVRKPGSGPSDSEIVA
jgi:hypothetical protein